MLVDEYNQACPFLGGIFDYEIIDGKILCAFTGNIVDDYIADDEFKNDIEFAKWLDDNISYWNTPEGQEHFIQFAFYRKLKSYEGQPVMVLPILEGHYDRNNKEAYILDSKNKPNKKHNK